MDNLVTLYHKAMVAKDDYGNDHLNLLKCKACLCYSVADHHLLSWLLRLRRSSWHANEDDITIEGVLNFVSKATILRQVMSIGCED